MASSLPDGEGSTLEDLLHPKNFKLSRRKCWGCFTEEKKGGQKHKDCTKCVESGYSVPACFCSTQCLKQYWPDHKKWHEANEARERATLLGGYQPDEDNNPYAIEGSEYSRLLSKAHVKIYAEKDLAGAAKVLKKAVKVDPRRPEAYWDIADCFDRSGNYADCFVYYEKAIEKLAVALLMNHLGDKDLSQSKEIEIQKRWALAVAYLMRFYAEADYYGRDVTPADWFREGPSLRRVTAFSMNILESQGLANLGELYGQIVDTRAFAMLTSNQHTKHAIYPEGAPWEMLSKEELNESARMYLLGSRHPVAPVANDMRSTAKEMLEFLRESPDFIEIEHRHMVAGLWVTVHGLQSAAGSKLNGKLGQITNDKRQNGRIPVVIGGVGNEPKLLKPQNLQEVDWPDRIFALLACLQDQSQWAFMTTKFGPEAFC